MSELIHLFNIAPVEIDTFKYTSLLHDGIVTRFEHTFADYVGARYAVAVNSETSAIFMIFRHFFSGRVVDVPAIIPPVVPTALINAGCTIRFTDNADWVGSSYLLHEGVDDTGTRRRVVDSAQRVDRDQYRTESESDTDIFLFSHYPTKPVGSCDGGTIVSNDPVFIGTMRQLCMNGTRPNPKSWNRELVRLGWKMYMNSIQAEIALYNLEELDRKKKLIAQARDTYNSAFSLSNTSDHLYRIEVNPDTRLQFLINMGKAGIDCGIHYESMAGHPVYAEHSSTPTSMLNSEWVSARTVSIPLHDLLRIDQLEHIIATVERNRSI